MNTRILDALGIAVFVAMVMVRAHVVHAATPQKPASPQPSAPYTPPCNDPSIPWWAKLDCYFL